MKEKYYFSMFNFGNGGGNLKKLRDKKLALVNGILAFNCKQIVNVLQVAKTFVRASNLCL
jgi:hypothetical protein